MGCRGNIKSAAHSIEPRIFRPRGASPVSTFNGKLKVDLSFFGDAIALRAMDVHSKSPLFASGAFYAPPGRLGRVSQLAVCRFRNAEAYSGGWGRWMDKSSTDRLPYGALY